MKVKLSWKLATLLFFVFLPYLAEATSVILPPEGFTITNIVKRCYLVFTGEVIDLEFVFRDNVPPQSTTDVTIKVEEMIKGEPNAGEKLVKFMIPRGDAVNPETGERVIGETVGTPEFKKGEKVLLFLEKIRTPLPYGGLFLFYLSIGKRVIKDGEVYIPYTVKRMVEIEVGKMEEMDDVMFIQLPIDLVVQIAKAYLKETKEKDAREDVGKDVLATELLEERIKEFIKQTPRGQMPKPDKEFIDSLRAEVRKILAKEE